MFITQIRCYAFTHCSRANSFVRLSILESRLGFSVGDVLMAGAGFRPLNWDTLPALTNAHILHNPRRAAAPLGHSFFTHIIPNEKSNSARINIAVHRDIIPYNLFHAFYNVNVILIVSLINRKSGERKELICCTSKFSAGDLFLTNREK